MINEIQLIGRDFQLFENDILDNEDYLLKQLANARCLVIGGGGSIGRAVTFEIFKRNPKTLHVVDLSENNLVELVREIRSTIGYSEVDFRTYAVDCGSIEFEVLFAAEGPYDYIFNLSALKHVRSEKDPFTLMRMIQVNILNSIKLVRILEANSSTRYFCVSTDKAANPVNMMGASKRIMEMFLMRESLTHPLTMARFANVAFSDGSLLHGFKQRFARMQPISAPRDVRRYFVTHQEAGELCLLAAVMGENRDIFFPKLDENLHLITFSEIAKKYLAALGYEAYECETEEEARKRCGELIAKGQWPCYFFESDTTGEKDYEEFFTGEEDLDLKRFRSIGIIKNPAIFDEDKLNEFENVINKLIENRYWTKEQIVNLFYKIIPDFSHLETGRYLDSRM